mgnify:CR=1 FL=1
MRTPLLAVLLLLPALTWAQANFFELIERDGDFELYLLDKAGSVAAQLTDNRSHDQQPEWSPDGTQIAFSNDGLFN